MSIADFIGILKGFGMFFVHPLFYFLILMSFIYAHFRVRKEREQFNVAVTEAMYDVRYFFTTGILLGLIMSIITFLIGIIIPQGVVILLAITTVLLSLTMRARLLSPAHTLGFTFIILILLTVYGNFTHPLYEKYVKSLTVDVYPALAILLGVLIIGEAVVYMKDKGRRSSPQIVKGKRGFNVGVHSINRLSLVPLMLVIPGELFTSPVPWWPLFSIGEQKYAIIVVPFVFGIFLQARGSLPKNVAKQTSKWLFVIAAVTISLAASSYFDSNFSIGAVAFALIARELLHLYLLYKDAKLPAYFTKQSDGVTILAIIPNSPADKMGLQIGETILKVNGVEVNDELNFYKALQINSAHCKIDVVDENKEMRFVQRALYEGDNHKLGVMFVS